MSSRRAPSHARLSPLEPGRRARRRRLGLGLVAAAVAAACALTATLVWLLA